MAVHLVVAIELMIEGLRVYLYRKANEKSAGRP